MITPTQLDIPANNPVIYCNNNIQFDINSIFDVYYCLQALRIRLDTFLVLYREDKGLDLSVIELTFRNVVMVYGVQELFVVPCDVL